MRPESEAKMAIDVPALIAKTLHIEKNLVTDDLSYQSVYEWSSLNHISLILALEEALGTTIDGALLVELTSVAAIKRYVQRQENQLAVQQQHEPDPKRAYYDTPIYRGLNKIVFDYTTTTHIDGEQGQLFYRGYSIHDLVTFSTFEEVAYLLLYKELPTRTQLEDFSTQLTALRGLPGPVVDLICAMPQAQPIDVLRTATSLLASYDPDRLDNSYEASLRKGMRLIAQLPTIVAIHQMKRSKRQIVPPTARLSHAGNILSLLTGEEPPARFEQVINKTLILHADHGSNASAFTARVVTGTQADIHGAITAAIAAFSGPLHGGAIEHTMKMLQEIADPEQASAYVQAQHEQQGPIMGFGHRVYQTEDPRARHLRQVVQELSHEFQEPQWLAILDALVHAMQPYARHGICVNVDFYACVIYHLLALPQDLFVPMFVLGRIAGWVAQVLEQWENNILIRPLMYYAGAVDRPYQLLEQRP
jgi:citrate synthase